MGSTPGPVQWVKGSGVAAAAAQVTTAAHIQSLAWELLCTVSVAIKQNKTGVLGRLYISLMDILFFLKQSLRICEDLKIII